MSDTLRKTFSRFLDLPCFGAQPSLPTETNPRFDFRRIRRNAAGEPDEGDLWAVAYLSHCNDRIRRTHPDLTPEKRAGLYSLWFAGNPDSILLLERTPPDSHGIRIIGNSTILPLNRSIFSLIERGALSVVKLRPENICGLGNSFDLLLLDTWVMHNDYQDFDRRFFFTGKRHFGYGNCLPLRHLSLFWDASGTMPLRLCVEPDSISMHEMTKRLGFSPKGQTTMGAPLLEIGFPPDTPESPENALARRYAREVVGKVWECMAWKLA